jgi:hypothetical protein
MLQSLLTSQLKEKPTYRVWCLYSSFVHGVCKAVVIRHRLPSFRESYRSTKNSSLNGVVLTQGYGSGIRESGYNLSTLIRIRILPFIKILGICDHWPTDPPRLHLSLQASIVSVKQPRWLYFEHLKLLNFYINADPDLVSKNNRIQADPDSYFAKKQGD